MATSEATRPAAIQSEPGPSSVLLWLCVFAPFAILGLLRLGQDWFPVQDQAVLDLRVRELLAGDLPALGAFSRYGWSHPGPVWFYVLAPFRAVLGTDGLLVGSVVLFGAGIATAAVLVRRRFGPGALLLALPVTLIALFGADSFTILIPWNPHLAAAWYAVLLVLCTSAVFRRSTDLAPAIFIGSLLVQLHVGYAALVIPLLAGVAVILGVRFRNVLARFVAAWIGVRAVRWWLLATLLAWLPPLLEQLANGREGNLWRIGSFFLGGSQEGPASGVSFALGALGGVIRHPLAAVGINTEEVEPFTGDVVPSSGLWMIPIVLLMLGSIATALYQRRWDLVRVMTLVWAAGLTGMFALARVLGDRWPYIFVWRYVLVWFCLGSAACVLGAVWAAGREFSLGTRSATVATWALIGLFAASLLGVFWDDYHDGFRPFGVDVEGSTKSLAAEVLARGRPDGPTQLVRSGGYLEGVADGVFNALDTEGWPVGVPEDLGFKFGGDNVVADEEAEHRWLISESSWRTTEMLATEGAEVVGFITPLDPESDDRLRELQLSVHAQLAPQSPQLSEAVGSSLIELFVVKEGLNVDDSDLAELAALNLAVEESGSCRCAVVAVPLEE